MISASEALLISKKAQENPEYVDFPVVKKQSAAIYELEVEIKQNAYLGNTMAVVDRQFSDEDQAHIRSHFFVVITNEKEHTTTIMWGKKRG